MPCHPLVLFLWKGWESVGEDLEQQPPRVPKLAWVDEEEQEEEEEEEEEEEGPGAAPEVETEEVQEFQPLEEDAAMDQTQEQDLACGLFHRTPAQRIWQEETSVMGTGSMEDGDVYTSDTSAAMMEFILEEGVSIPEQVPAMVRYIHQCLMANESADSRLGRTLLDLTEAQPADVVIALLRVAPTCDRYEAHVPRGLRAPQPISLHSLAQVSDQQRVPGSCVPGTFPSPAPLAPEPAAMLWRLQGRMVRRERP
ncbi:histone H3.v1-like [Cyanistes caeruleus]|uniref:histone H3.v1-like n=1 Tax=Cyanistes caeruleus TaxID=156563 RepID=UPI000CDB8056|nr:histone H3.v1-like [Cyanistes caeruleus]